MKKLFNKLVDIPTLDESNITNLKNYKYSSGEYTAFDKIMNHFWIFSAKFVPRVNFQFFDF